MTEWSAWWTTSGSPSGHQETSYTQAHLTTIAEIIGSCSAFEGVAPAYLNELVGAVQAVNTFRIGTGGCIGDGKVYKNDAAVDVNIPSAAGGGNTRIDRVVVRFIWASFQGVITRIAGIDAGSPTPPAATKTPGSTYDILLYQVNVDTSGNLTIELDEREWGVHEVDNSTIEVNAGALRVKDLGITSAKLVTDAVETAKIKNLNVTSGKLAANAVIAGKVATNAVEAGDIATGGVTAGDIATGGVSATAQLANDIVDDTKVGNRVPQFYRRQGGSSSNWATKGNTSYTPTTVRMQGGVKEWAAGASTDGIVSVTFPTAFSNAPIVLVTVRGSIADDIVVSTQTPSTTGVVIMWKDAGGETHTSVEITWLAIGPE